MTNKLTFQFYSDIGHGWLKVPKKLLFDLQIHREISVYSYHYGKFAYLEEDCDAAVLLEKLKEKGIEFTVKENHTDQSSHIRMFEDYTPSCVLIG